MRRVHSAIDYINSFKAKGEEPIKRFYHHAPRSAQATLRHARNVIDKHYHGEKRQLLLDEITALFKEDEERKLFYARPMGEKIGSVLDATVKRLNDRRADFPVGVLTKAPSTVRHQLIDSMNHGEAVVVLHLLTEIMVERR